MNLYMQTIKLLADTSVTVNNGKTSNSYTTNLPNVSASHSDLTTILNIVIATIAVVSVLFVVVGGLRYVLSDGDPQQATRARETIIYAVVGLLIAITAEGIVAFVLNNINKTT